MSRLGPKRRAVPVRLPPRGAKVPLTPDRSGRGVDYDDTVQMADRGGGDPAIEATMAYSGGAMRFRDAQGVFDPRCPWAGIIGGVHLDAAGTLYKNVTGTLKPSAVSWFSDAAKTKKLMEAIYSYAGSNALVPTTIAWALYDKNGTTVLRRATDTITYSSGVFEASRTRVFS